MLMKNGEIARNYGWRSNTIVADYGRFLAALMKKEFPVPVGIEYLAVGSGSQDDSQFKDKVAAFFNWLNEDPARTGPMFLGENWVWAKKIGPGDISYLDGLGDTTNDVTNRVELQVKFEQNEPTEKTLSFQEFALLGINKNEEGIFDTGRLFLINYVTHGVITKDKDTELSRAIKLIFPITN